MKTPLINTMEPIAVDSTAAAESTPDVPVESSTKKSPRQIRLPKTRLTISFILLFVVGIICWPPSLGGPFTFAVVAGKSMEPGYHTGDLVVAIRQPSGYAVGDSVVYMVDEGELHGRVVHRIVEQLPNGNFLTRGDNKPYNDPWEVKPQWISGKVQWMIPQAVTYIGIMRSPIFLGTMFGLLVIFLCWPQPQDDDQDPGEAEAPQTQ